MTLALQSLPFLWEGLLVTLHVSALVLLFSLVAGLVLGVALVFGPRWLYWPIRMYSDFLRGIPLLVLIFFVYYGLPVFRINLSNFWAAVFALAAFKTAHVIEIVRGAMQSIPRGQTDAGCAIGLTFAQRLLWVIAPQAVRRFLPPWINAVVWGGNGTTPGGRGMAGFKSPGSTMRWGSGALSAETTRSCVGKFAAARTSTM